MAGDPKELESGRPVPHPPTPINQKGIPQDGILMSNVPSPSIFTSQQRGALPTVINSHLIAQLQNNTSPSPPSSPSPDRGDIPSLQLINQDEEQDITMTSTHTAPIQKDLTPAAQKEIQELTSRANAGIALTVQNAPFIAPPASKARTLRDRTTAAAARGDAKDTQHAPSRSPLDKYTTAPEMPRVQDAFPAALITNLDLALLDEWFSYEGQKLLIVPFEDKARDPDLKLDIGEKILTAVEEITASQKAAVGPPVPKSNITKLRQMPITYIAYHLSQAEYNTLLSRHVWSSEAITFRVIPTDPPCPDFLFTIRGFTTLDKSHVHTMVSKV